MSSPNLQNPTWGGINSNSLNPSLIAIQDASGSFRPATPQDFGGDFIHTGYVFIQDVSKIVVSSGMTSGFNVIPTSGNLIEVNGFNYGPNQFILIVNGQKVIQPNIKGQVYAKSGDNFFWNANGEDILFQSGITVVNSTGTTPIDVMIGKNDCFYSVVYRV